MNFSTLFVGIGTFFAIVGYVVASAKPFLFDYSCAALLLTSLFFYSAAFAASYSDHTPKTSGGGAPLHP